MSGQARTGRLAALVHGPGGLTAEEAVRAATKKLEEIRGKGVGELGELLRALLASGAAALAATEPTARLAALDRTYKLANSVVGVAGPFGFKGLGVVAYSLCELIDRLRSSGSWSAAAMQVHLDGLRLMHDSPSDEAGIAAMQAALKEMIQRLG